MSDVRAVMTEVLEAAAVELTADPDDWGDVARDYVAMVESAVADHGDDLVTAAAYNLAGIVAQLTLRLADHDAVRGVLAHAEDSSQGDEAATAAAALVVLDVAASPDAQVDALGEEHVARGWDTWVAVRTVSAHAGLHLAVTEQVGGADAEELVEVLREALTTAR